MEDHDCLESLEYHQKQFSEVMDPEVDCSTDRWWEEWWECTICGEKLTPSELTRLQNQREVKDGDGTETEIRER